MVGKIIEAVIVGAVMLYILVWLGQFAFALLWIPVKTAQVRSRVKHHRCPECKAAFVKHWSAPADHLYSSKVTHSECPNGHIYTSGNARFADWAGF